MPWWDILKRKSSDQSEAPLQPASPRRELPMVQSAASRPKADPNDPAVRERRRARLERRIRDLRYDIGQAELAQTDDNRWTERIDGCAQASGAHHVALDGWAWSLQLSAVRLSAVAWILP